MQSFFQIQQTLSFFLRYLLHRNFCPGGYGTCNILLRHFHGTGLNLFLRPLFLGAVFLLLLFQPVMKRSGVLKASFLHRRLQFRRQLFAGSFQLMHLLRKLIQAQLPSGRGLIHQIDGLVRKKTVIEVTF